MKNVDTIRNLCTAIANTYYPDNGSIEVVMLNEGVDGEAESTPKDPIILKCAITLVKGYIEGSSSQNGISTSVRSQEAIEKSIRYYCGVYGVDLVDMGVDGVVLTNCSDMW